MHVPSIDIFEWLLQNASKAKFNLAFSNITGVRYDEYQKLSRYTIPSDFDLGINTQYGSPELKEVLSSLYKTTTESIVITTGATEANYLVTNSLLDKGDKVIIEQPAYQPLYRTVEMLGATCRFWPRPFTMKFHLDLDTLSTLFTKKTKLVIITNLHNPSGVLTDKKTITAVAKLAAEHHAYVLVDEIYLDGCLTPQPSSFGIENVIVSSSATKIYGLGGLHTGWIIAPPKVATPCQQMKAHTTGATSYLSEIMTASILRKARGELMQRFQKQARTNRAVIKEWMDQHQDLFTWVIPDGGIVCFPKYSKKISSVDLSKHLLKTQGVFVNPGAFFNQEGHIRVSYGGNTEQLNKGLAALEKGMNSCK